MIAPPVVIFRQGAAHSKDTFAGTIHSVIQPGFDQSRPVTTKDDFCRSYQQNTLL
jgi:hypothetical protein